MWAQCAPATWLLLSDNVPASKKTQLFKNSISFVFHFCVQARTSNEGERRAQYHLFCVPVSVVVIAALAYARAFARACARHCALPVCMHLPVLVPVMVLVLVCVFVLAHVT